MVLNVCLVALAAVLEDLGEVRAQIRRLMQVEPELPLALERFLAMGRAAQRLAVEMRRGNSDHKAALAERAVFLILVALAHYASSHNHLVGRSSGCCR